jgi:diguanylate cyclase (GGDEF)-like protein
MLQFIRHFSFQDQPSIIPKTLANLAIRVACVILMSAIFSYLFVFGQTEYQVQEQLSKYVIERGKREAEVFRLAADRHKMLKPLLLSSAPITHPLSSMYAWSDGTHRNFPENRSLSEFDGTSHAAIFLGRNQPLTPALKQKLAMFEQLVLQYGLAWRDRATNTYLLAPENAAVLYWPEIPGPLMVPGDFDIRNEVFFYLSDLAHNPDRQTVWTNVYHDPASPDWIVSVITPIDDQQGHQIATIGHDIILTDLIQRTLRDSLTGTYNLIFSQDGHLIVHPDFGDEIQTKDGNLTIQDINQPHLNHIFQQVVEASSDGINNANVIDNKTDGEFLAITRLAGPNWYFVTVYPQALLRPTAFAAAKFIVMSGALSLLVEVILMYGVLRQQVAMPLQELEQLSLLDGLTQLGNRRQFDIYLLQEWKRLQRQREESLSLILCDVDFFKCYNDHYGHQAGDACLQQIAKALQSIPKRPSDLVARYGGEEFAIILPMTDQAGAIVIAAEIQQAIHQLQLPHATSKVSDFVTLSIGISTLQSNLEVGIEMLITQADAALYQAKQQGRDQFCWQEVARVASFPIAAEASI